jgi:hypothetical protein
MEEAVSASESVWVWDSAWVRELASEKAMVVALGWV